MSYSQLRDHPFALYVLVAVVCVLLLSFSSIRKSRRPCLAMRADIYPIGLHFLSEDRLLSLVDKHSRRPLLGQSTDRINLQDIESRLSDHSFVKQLEVYRHHNGDIQLNLSQKEPLARIIYSDQSSQYLTQDGELLDLSPDFTARVLILRLPYPLSKAKANWNELEHLQHGMWKMLRKLRGDAFWSAQIAQCNLSKENELTIYTQLSRQLIYFGEPEDVQAKLDRLYLFYDRILPHKGWNRYRKVDVRFENQIVCR